MTERYVETRGHADGDCGHFGQIGAESQQREGKNAPRMKQMDLPGVYKTVQGTGRTQ